MMIKVSMEMQTKHRAVSIILYEQYQHNIIRLSVFKGRGYFIRLRLFRPHLSFEVQNESFPLEWTS